MLFEKNDKLLFIGDSISDFDRKRPVGEGLFNGWGTSYVSDVGALLCCMYPELGLRIVNMGVSGNRVPDLRDRWESDVIALKPDWVSVLIGINDVWRQFDSPEMPEEATPIEDFERIYEDLIERTLPLVKGMILMTPYIIEPNTSDAMRAQMDRYGLVVRRLAEKHGLVFVDTQTAWDALCRYRHPCSIAWDHIHPNQIGHMYLAKTFLSAVGFDR